MTGVTDQMSMAGQHQAEVHGNDVASTSEQKPDIAKSESGTIIFYLSCITGSLSSLLCGFHKLICIVA